MNQQLSEIKEALSKATQGPWTIDVWEKTNEVGIEYGISKYVAVMGNKNENKHQDAHLIANAPQWLTSLVSQVEEMQKTLEWAARIIDSGMGAGILRYDPVQWFITYHTYLQSLKGEDKHE